MVGFASVEFSEAVKIRPGERDRRLDLLNAKWPDALNPSNDWVPNGPTLARRVQRSADLKRAEKDLLRGDLAELMLRFPSAPIHGVQRLHEYHADLDTAETMHTYRLLKHPDHTGPPSRIVLMHNGLNEREDAVLYYQLASQLIIDREPATACLLRPFPGHLTRFPWDDFGETPLDRYLWDGSHLFRQFLRYMTETQWLLSAIVGDAEPETFAGAPILRGEDPATFEQDLAEMMLTAWNVLFEESHKAINVARQEQDQATEPDEGNRPTKATLLAAIRSLRGALSLDAEDRPRPSLHVVGYSLGGFTAQSVFMTWPSVVSSCVTLLSGGPLAALAPTAFAHPEEWQTVLHSLRYELDDGMINRRYEDSGRGIAGLDSHLFQHFQRAFYEVFKQEYLGSFQSRIAAFRKRMFFIVGGDDPIVNPKAVLDSSPEGGMHVLEIGGMGHFLGGRARDDDEQAERSFWIPQIGRWIHDFSTQADELHKKELLAAEKRIDELELDEPSLIASPGFSLDPRRTSDDERLKMRLTEKERLRLSPDRALPSALFGRYLDDLLARALAPADDKDSGFLWIFRNEIPTIMLDDEALLRRAQALFHDEPTIAQYCDEVRRRRDAWGDALARIVVVLPWNVERILANQDADHGFASQAETSMGPSQGPKKTSERIAALRATCLSATASDEHKYSVLVFDGRAHIRRRELDPASQLPPSLPDVWMYTSRDFLDVNSDATVSAAWPALVIKAREHTSNTKTSTLEKRLQEDKLRLVTVSRSRFNPRFRGRYLAHVNGVRALLRHTGLCLHEAYTYREFNFDADGVYPPLRPSHGDARSEGQQAGERRKNEERRVREGDRRGLEAPVNNDQRFRIDRRRFQRRREAAPPTAVAP